MAIEKNFINRHYGILSETINVNKNEWVKIMDKASVIRHLVILNMEVQNGFDDYISISTSKDGSNSIDYRGVILDNETFKFYQGELYAKVHNNSVNDSFDVKVWQNNKD